MTSEYLEQLTSPDFESRIVASTPRILRLLLLRADEVSELRTAYDSGEVSSADIRAFVDGLLRKHATEAVFPHQIALAAIAVMLDRGFTDFAKEYLGDLARLNNERFWRASHVARICERRRSVLARNKMNHFDMPEERPLAQIGFVVKSTNHLYPTDIVVTRHEGSLEHA